MGRIVVRLLIAGLVSQFPEPALAIGPRAGVSAATVDMAHPEVGQIGDETSLLANGTIRNFATGTKIGPNLVLTCAHAVDSGFLLGGGEAYESHSNLFQLDGQAPVFGLGIPHPNYDFQNIGINDVALILTATPIPGATAALAIGPAEVAGGNPITLVGYGGRGGGGSTFGTRLTGTANANAPTASRISFSVSNPATMAGQNYTEPGDSGSPYFRTVPGQGIRIVGVHNFGNAGSFPSPIPNPVTFAGQRITDPNVNSFLLGNGLSAADRTGLIISWADDTSNNFNSNNWTTGVGITTPAANHIVNLNRQGATPTITVTTDTPVLYGLLNDDRLDVTGGRLRITGNASAPGLFNGPNGTINVNATRLLATTALDNFGAINVNARAQLTASRSSFNSQTLAINTDATGGGEVLFSGGLKNYGTISLNVGVGAMLEHEHSYRRRADGQRSPHNWRSWW